MASKKEHKLAELLWIHQQQKHERYKRAYVEKNLDDVEFDYQAMMLIEILTDWRNKLDKKAKPEQYKNLQKMIQGAVTMLAYKQTQNNRMNCAIVDKMDAERQHDKAMRKNAKLEKTIHSLKAEIAYYENEKAKR